MPKLFFPFVTAIASILSSTTAAQCADPLAEVRQLYADINAKDLVALESFEVEDPARNECVKLNQRGPDGSHDILKIVTASSVGGHNGRRAGDETRDGLSEGWEAVDWTAAE